MFLVLPFAYMGALSVFDLWLFKALQTVFLRTKKHLTISVCNGLIISFPRSFQFKSPGIT